MTKTKAIKNLRSERKNVSKNRKINRSHISCGRTKKMGLSNSMKQSSWEIGSRSAGQEIPRLSWNPKFHCRDYESPPLDPLLNRFSSFIPLHSSSLKHFLILSSHLHLGLPTGLFKFFPEKKNKFSILTSLMHPNCSTYLIHLIW